MALTVLTAALADLRFDELSETAIEHAKIALSSTLASAAAGVTLPSVELVSGLATGQGGLSEATVWFRGGLRLPAAQAGRLNAMASDAAASDDADFRNISHTGTTVCAVALAVGERGHVGGRDVIEAIVAGYEMCGRLGEAAPDIHELGIHPVAFNCLGAATSAAKVLGATPEQLATAVSLAATAGWGMVAATHTWSREFQAGSAVRAGIDAALAAMAGYWADTDLVDGAKGLLAILSRVPEREALDRNLSREWDISTDLGIKLWPGAYPFAAAVEAGIDAAVGGDVDPTRVKRIVVTGPSITVNSGLAQPRDFVEAIHSLAYFVAAGVADRDFGWGHVSQEKIDDPTIQALAALVEIVPLPPDGERYDFKWGATVTIEMLDGTAHKRTVNAPKGSARRGIAWADIDAKLFSLMGTAGHPRSSIEKIAQAVHSLDDCASVAELTRLL